MDRTVGPAPLSFQVTKVILSPGFHITRYNRRIGHPEWGTVSVRSRGADADSTGLNVTIIAHMIQYNEPRGAMTFQRNNFVEEDTLHNSLYVDTAVDKS